MATVHGLLAHYVLVIALFLSNSRPRIAGGQGTRPAQNVPRPAPCAKLPPVFLGAGRAIIAQAIKTSAVL